MQGGANRAQFHVPTPGSPDTLSTTPDYTCEKIISTNPDGLISKKQVTISMEIDDYSVTSLTALIALVSESDPAEDTAEYYENDELSAEGTSGGTTVTRSVLIKYGGWLSSTKVHVIIAMGYVTNASWAHTTKHGEKTKPALEYKTMKQTTGNTIVLDEDLFDGTIVDVTSPSPALPTALTGGTYGGDYPMTRA